MSIYVKTSAGLEEIGGSVTKEKIVEALGYLPADKNDLNYNIIEDESGEFKIVDENGNIIMEVDAEGIHTTEVFSNGVKLGETVSGHVNNKTIHVTSEEKETWNSKSNFGGAYEDLDGRPNVIENESGDFVIADGDGNVIARVDDDGITTTKVNTKEIVLNGEDLDSRLKNLESSSSSNILDDESDRFEVADKAGNVIARIDKNGLETTGVKAESVVIEKQETNESGETITTIINVGDIIEEHIADTDIHITEEEREKWNSYKSFDGEYDSLNGSPDIEGMIRTAVTEHADDDVIHVTEEDRTKWDNKSNFSGEYSDLKNGPNIVEDESGELAYVDADGNIIAKVTDEGILTTDVILIDKEQNRTSVKETLDNYVLDVDLNGEEEGDGTELGDYNSDVDDTLSISGVPADSKKTGDEIAKLTEMIGGVPVSEQIAEAIVEVYVQDDEPEDAAVGSIWVDTDETGLDAPEGEQYNRNLYVIDAGTSDTSSIDFSGYAVGDIILITTS